MHFKHLLYIAFNDSQDYGKSYCTEHLYMINFSVDVFR